MTPLKDRAQAVLDAGEGMTAGPWKWATSNSWRRLGSASRHTPDGDVLCPVTRRDGHADLHVSKANARAIAATPEAHAVIRELLAENARLREALSAIREEITFEINPSNYDHDQVCEMNTSWCQIGLIADAALTLSPQQGAATSAESDWQPIEAAPKDGSLILLGGVMPEEFIEAGQWQAVVAYWTPFNHGGWVWHGPCPRFTHWMPLPDAPALAAMVGTE